MMNASVELIFKRKPTEGSAWRRIYKVAGSPRSVCIEATSGKSPFGCDLNFDIKSLKELSILISEFLLHGEDVEARKRGDSEKPSPKFRVPYAFFDLSDENILIEFADSKDLESSLGTFIIQVGDKEHIDFNFNVTQARKISQALKRFVLAHDLVEDAHKKKAIPVPNPA